MEQTKAQEKAVELIMSFADAIKELGSIPSGHLYARLMDSLNLDEYSMIIAKLQTLDLIKVENNLITWIGE